MADCHLAWVPPSRDDDGKLADSSLGSWVINLDIAAWDVWITSRAALAAMATEPPCAVDSDVFLRSDFTGQLVFPGCDTTSPPGSLLGEYDNNQAQGQDLTSSVPGVDLWKGPDVLADPIEVGTSASESTTQWPFFSDDIDSFYPPPLQPEPQAAERLGQKYEEAQRGLIVASDNIPDWTLDFERDKLTVKDKKGVVDDWDRALLEMTNRSHASSVRGLQKPKRGHVNGLEMKRQPQVFEMVLCNVIIFCLLQRFDNLHRSQFLDISKTGEETYKV